MDLLFCTMRFLHCGTLLAELFTLIFVTFFVF